MFEVIDTITGEILEFEEQMDAEMVAHRRLQMHREGYNVRRSHVSGCNAVLTVKNNKYIISIAEVK